MDSKTDLKLVLKVEPGFSKRPKAKNSVHKCSVALKGQLGEGAALSVQEHHLKMDVSCLRIVKLFALHLENKVVSQACCYYMLVLVKMVSDWVLPFEESESVTFVK